MRGGTNLQIKQLKNTSEKTVEINVLHELISCLENGLKKSITAFAPTQLEEKELGFDEIIDGLPPGRILALQFKRPQEHSTGVDFAKFSINSDQLRTLLQKFPHTGQAFYVFSSFPTTEEFVRERKQLMQRTVAVDIHDFEPFSGTRQLRSTVKIEKRTCDVRIAHNRTYHQIMKKYTMKSLCENLAGCKIGMKIKSTHKLKNDAEYSSDNRTKKIIKITYVYTPNE